MSASTDNLVGIRFRDRTEAGRFLARELSAYADRDDVVVLALPRGGVPLGYEVAKALGAPLDVFVVRKLGVPGHEELAMGAIASGGLLVLDEQLVGQLGISSAQLAQVAATELRELEIVSPLTPRPFRAVGLWYENFPQTSDEEVRALLARAGERAEPAG